MELIERTVFSEHVDKTAAFYQLLLGRDPIVEEESIAIFEEGQTTLLVHETYEESKTNLPPDDHVAYAVEDLDLTFNDLKNAGLEPFKEPADYDWGRSGYLKDPDGRIVELRET